MTHTIFGRGESKSVVRQSELLHLWAMINNVNIDTGSHFIRHLVKVGKATTGSIVVGGLITPIALTLGHEMFGLEEAIGSSRVDLEACCAMHMIVRDGDVYCLTIKDRLPHPLPDQNRTSVQNRANWLMTDVVLPPVPIDIDRPPRRPTRLEPSRHSFSFGGSSTGHTGYDFLEMTATLSTIREEQAEQKRLANLRNERAEQFYQRVDLYFNRGDEHFRRLEEHERLLEEYGRQFQEIYDWHRLLVHILSFLLFRPLHNNLIFH